MKKLNVALTVVVVLETAAFGILEWPSVGHAKVGNISMAKSNEASQKNPDDRPVDLGSCGIVGETTTCVP